mgnify:CR=1 FL=1
MGCNTPEVQHDPDCKHEDDAIERAFYIVADSILRHMRSGKDWDCTDQCWHDDVQRARKIIEGEVEKARGLI